MVSLVDNTFIKCFPQENKYTIYRSFLSKEHLGADLIWGMSQDVQTIWPAWIFELGLLKFSHFVSNSLRNVNVQNDVQIFQFWLHELLNLPEKLIFEGVFCVNIFLNSFFRKSTLAIFFRYPFEVLLFVMQTCEVKYDRYFSIHSAS